MKIVLITFSLTGNTLIVANRIEHELYKTGKHTVIHFDGFKIIKLLGLETKISKPINVQNIDNYLFTKLINELNQADVIGLGAYVNTFRPPPGVYELSSKVVYLILLSLMQNIASHLPRMEAFATLHQIFFIPF